ncbi:helix-turn-helix domain-containing protein [Streptomyces sp. NPDC058293]|uniref:helix-turn-helix domain-containing protein n=1 Tax=unclassified Streptomyces TaxID=2593676 RepID=UPI00224D7C3E|nr:MULTISPECIES: helix-turn-helix transcriptional regulator [unclassified Streptomyces]MCX4645217.1 helix-turn-helix domain-containing protein [Streptomyces sp. NBC_01446]MCX5326015.1 helix-turn-helix domain-containing protein [Streptomyces sp. NBC_00120]
MAKRTQGWKELPPEYSDEKRAFADALRRVKDCTDLTQERVAKECGVATSTLNGYLNGRNQPRPEVLRKFYAAIRQDTDLAGVRIPHSLDELLLMLSGQPDWPGSIAAKPAVRITQRRHTAAFARQRQLRARKRVRVPVPLPEGDRHPQMNEDAGWTELETLMSRLLRRQTQDAFFMIWQSAMSLPAGEIPRVVASCRSAGLSEAADAVITNAARRDVGAVLRIVASFHAAQQYEDATLLLNSAISPGS